jgi:hypothetical protein
MFLTLAFAARIQCKTLAFGYKPCHILGVLQCFSKYCSCSPQGENVLIANPPTNQKHNYRQSPKESKSQVKSQDRVRHPLGNKTHILRDISLTCGKQKPEIFNKPSLGILVCLEGERAYPTLVGHVSECVKNSRILDILGAIFEIQGS